MHVRVNTYSIAKNECTIIKISSLTQADGHFCPPAHFVLCTLSLCTLFDFLTRNSIKLVIREYIHIPVPNQFLRVIGRVGINGWSR